MLSIQGFRREGKTKLWKWKLNMVVLTWFILECIDVYIAVKSRELFKILCNIFRNIYCVTIVGKGKSYVVLVRWWAGFSLRCFSICPPFTIRIYKSFHVTHPLKLTLEMLKLMSLLMTLFTVLRCWKCLKLCWRKICWEGSWIFP